MIGKTNSIVVKVKEATKKAKPQSILRQINGGKKSW